MAASWVGRRKSERRQCSVRAQMVFRNGRDPVDCVMVDSSASGARIQFSESLDLPPRFMLSIPSRSETKYVILRWSNENEAGLEYSSNNSQADEEMLELLERMDQIESQIAALNSAPQPAAHALAHNLELVPPEQSEANGVTLGLPPATIGEVYARIDEIESVAADCSAELERVLRARIDQLERRMGDAHLVSGAERVQDNAPHADDMRFDALAMRLDELERRFDHVLAAQKGSPAPHAMSDQFDHIDNRLAQLERASGATHAAGQIIERWEQDFHVAVQEIGALDGRLSSLETMAAQEAAPAAAPNIYTPLDPESYEQRFLKIERRLGELSQNAAPGETLASSRVLQAFDQRLDQLSTRVEVLAMRQPPEASEPSPEPLKAGEDQAVLETLFERVSNVEVEMLNVKFDRAPVDNPEYDARLSKLETESHEIHSLLKNLLVLLTARNQDERSAG